VADKRGRQAIVRHPAHVIVRETNCRGGRRRDASIDPARHRRDRGIGEKIFRECDSVGQKENGAQIGRRKKREDREKKKIWAESAGERRRRHALVAIPNRGAAHQRRSGKSGIDTLHHVGLSAYGRKRIVSQNWHLR